MLRSGSDPLDVGFFLLVELVVGVRFFRTPDGLAELERFLDPVVEPDEREAGLVDLGEEATVDGVAGCWR